MLYDVQSSGLRMMLIGTFGPTTFGLNPPAPTAWSMHQCKLSTYFFFGQILLPDIDCSKFSPSWVPQSFPWHQLHVEELPQHSDLRKCLIWSRRQCLHYSISHWPHSGLPISWLSINVLFLKISLEENCFCLSKCPHFCTSYLPHFLLFKLTNVLHVTMTAYNFAYHTDHITLPAVNRAPVHPKAIIDAPGGTLTTL